MCPWTVQSLNLKFIVRVSYQMHLWSVVYWFGWHPGVLRPACKQRATWHRYCGQATKATNFATYARGYGFWQDIWFKSTFNFKAGLQLQQNRTISGVVRPMQPAAIEDHKIALSQESCHCCTWPRFLSQKFSSVRILRRPDRDDSLRFYCGP